MHKKFLRTFAITVLVVAISDATIRGSGLAMYVDALEEEIVNRGCTGLICSPQEITTDYAGTKQVQVPVGNSTVDTPFGRTSITHYETRSEPTNIRFVTGHYCRYCSRDMGAVVTDNLPPIFFIKVSGGQKSLGMRISTFGTGSGMGHLCSKPRLTRELETLWDKAGLTNAKHVTIKSGVQALWKAAVSEDKPNSIYLDASDQSSGETIPLTVPDVFIERTLCPCCSCTML